MKKEESFHLLLWRNSHIVSSQQVSFDSSGSNSSLQKFEDKLWLGFTKRDGSCAYWPSWRWAYWWQGEAWDGLDIVLSMSSRLARRWQSLIMRSQFVKQEERLEGGWGCWRRVETEWLERSSEIEGLEESFRSRWQYCFVKRRLGSDPNVIMDACAKANFTAPVWTCIFISAQTLEIKSVWHFMFLLFMSSASVHFIAPPPGLTSPPRHHSCAVTSLCHTRYRGFW